MAGLYNAVFTQTLTSNQSFPATGIDLGSGWSKIFIQIPVCASGNHGAYFAAASDATYFPVAREYGTGIIDSLYSIDSSITDAIVEIPAAGRYMKVWNTSGCTDVHTIYKIFCT